MENKPLAERLRPKTLDDYIGQQHLVGKGKVLRKMIESGVVSSFILWGPPGVGKTTLAMIVAEQLKRPFYVLSAVSSGVKDVREVIQKAESQRFFNTPNPILFIDEIHRLPKTVEEILYSAMEDYALDIIIGKGPAARSVRLDLPRFTLIGATTRMGSVAAPLRDRFGVICHLEFYTAEELQIIVERAAEILNVKIDHEGAYEIGRRSRGTPRVANRLLKRVRDFAEVAGADTITKEICRKTMERLEIDDLGLDRSDRRLLTKLVKDFGGRPVGVDTLAASLNEESETLEDVYEPYLMQLGMLQRTPKGRQATAAAYRYLGIAYPEGR